MANRYVKWFSSEKGYGFVTPTTAAQMCSCTSAPSSEWVTRTSKGPEGRVRRDLGQKGPQAANVQASA